MKNKRGNQRITELAQLLMEYASELSSLTSSTEQSGKKTAVETSGNSLFYAVYAGEGNRSYLAVCLDDPFCYGCGRDRDAAIKDLLSSVREKYGCGHVLDGISVPDHLPEDF